MDEEEAARYLRQPVPIPAAVRDRFGDANELPRANAAAMLSSAMALRSDEQPTFIVGLMLVLLVALASYFGGNHVAVPAGTTLGTLADTCTPSSDSASAIP